MLFVCQWRISLVLSGMLFVCVFSRSSALPTNSVRWLLLREFLVPSLESWKISSGLWSWRWWEACFALFLIPLNNFACLPLFGVDDLISTVLAHPRACLANWLEWVHSPRWTLSGGTTRWCSFHNSTWYSRCCVKDKESCIRKFPCLWPSVTLLFWCSLFPC